MDPMKKYDEKFRDKEKKIKNVSKLSKELAIKTTIGFSLYSITAGILMIMGSSNAWIEAGIVLVGYFLYLLLSKLKSNKN